MRAENLQKVGNIFGCYSREYWILIDTLCSVTTVDVREITDPTYLLPIYLYYENTLKTITANCPYTFSKVSSIRYNLGYNVYISRCNDFKNYCRCLSIIKPFGK